MGKPIDKPIPRSTPLMSYGKKRMRPEYWFSVPKNKVDELFNFVQAWVPYLYGELNEEHVRVCQLSDNGSIECFYFGLQVRGRGFSLVEPDTELWSDEPTPSASRHGSQDGEITELTKESWEVSLVSFSTIHFICEQHVILYALS